MLVSDFDYDLPEELIAQEPLEVRSGSRMLVVHRGSKQLEDRMFRDFSRFLQPGDCVVLNDSKVFPSRLLGVRARGTARVEVFLIRSITDDSRTWQALVRPGRKLPVGESIRFSDTLSCEVLDRGEHGERTIRFAADGDVFSELERHGHTPLPPYIRRPDREQDRSRYNTVYASQTGSVAAPTAGLHFTPEILDEIRATGASIATVTLHVGLGTFAPVRAERVADITLHAERYCVSRSSWATIERAERRFAVGTTTVRTLETIRAGGALSGETTLFLSPGDEIRAVDGILTNFHLPKSSLMMLVSAFAGRDLILSAYQHAVAQRYRFFSYGDCMLILP